MASIFKRWIVRDGKRIKTKKYFIKYKDATGRWIVVAGSESKEISRKKANLLEHDAECIKRGLVDPFADPKKESLQNHLTAFSNHLESDENTPEYVKRTKKRITDIFADCGFKTIDDLIRYDARGKVADALKARRKVGLSCASSNHYLTAIKNFLNWAAKDSRMPQSPILLIEKISTTTDDAKKRRALTQEEFAKLIEKTRKGEITHQLTGEQRAWLYMIAAYSGLRAGELYSLTQDSFHLDLDQPFIELRAEDTKNGQPTQQPIRRDFADMLKGWLEGQEGHLFTRLACKRSAEMLRVDLKSAKIPEETAEGVVDFHALRVTYITNLARSGIHPKTAQILARHSDIQLTMKVYTKLGRNEVADALKAMPAAHHLAHHEKG